MNTNTKDINKKKKKLSYERGTDPARRKQTHHKVK